ncbi:helix-turn-helix transcriptional regulator [bacterium]|nr:helix-turn-helix transcriptional regulator [bacterium]
MVDEKIYRIEQIVRDNVINPPFGVKELASKAGLSVSYLRELVYKHCRMSPQDLIVSVRLEKAIEAMYRNHALLYNISNDHGFTTYKSFSRALRSRLDLSPQQCRELLISEEQKEKLLQKLWKKND